MLRQILERMTQGGAWTAEALAHEMGTTPELVAMMLEELARQGYLKPAGSPCSGACASCPAAASCSSSFRARLRWTLNPDGGRWTNDERRLVDREGQWIEQVNSTAE